MLNRNEKEDFINLFQTISPYITDQRLIINIKNEYKVYKDVLSNVFPNMNEASTNTDATSHSFNVKLFAMTVYRNIYLSDAEKIPIGNSKLNEIYNAWTEIKEAAIQEQTRRLRHAGPTDQLINSLDNMSHTLALEDLGKSRICDFIGPSSSKEFTNLKYPKNTKNETIKNKTQFRRNQSFEGHTLSEIIDLVYPIDNQLIKELLSKGYIGEDFVLYTISLPDKLRPRTAIYLALVIGAHQQHIFLKLDSEDIEEILHHFSQQLSYPYTFNSSILDYLLDALLHQNKPAFEKNYSNLTREIIIQSVQDNLGREPMTFFLLNSKYRAESENRSERKIREINKCIIETLSKTDFDIFSYILGLDDDEDTFIERFPEDLAEFFLETALPIVASQKSGRYNENCHLLIKYVTKHYRKIHSRLSSQGAEELFMNQVAIICAKNLIVKYQQNTDDDIADYGLAVPDLTLLPTTLQIACSMRGIFELETQYGKSIEQNRNNLIQAVKNDPGNPGTAIQEKLSLDFMKKAAENDFKNKRIEYIDNSYKYSLYESITERISSYLGILQTGEYSLSSAINESELGIILSDVIVNGADLERDGDGILYSSYIPDYACDVIKKANPSCFKNRSNSQSTINLSRLVNSLHGNLDSYVSTDCNDLISPILKTIGEQFQFETNFSNVNTYLKISQDSQYPIIDNTLGKMLRNALDTSSFEASGNHDMDRNMAQAIVRGARSGNFTNNAKNNPKETFMESLKTPKVLVTKLVAPYSSNPFAQACTLLVNMPKQQGKYAGLEYDQILKDFFIEDSDGIGSIKLTINYIDD